MAYFPITFFATDYLCQWMDKKYPIQQWVVVGFLGLAMVIGSCLVMIPWIMLHKALLCPLLSIQNHYCTKCARNMELLG